MSEYLIREEQMKELADIIREKFLLDYEDADLTLIAGDKDRIAFTSLPEGITQIGDGAFYECTNLALTSLPESITSIGYYAFRRCKSLALTYLPEGVTSIGNYAFDGCTSLTSLTFEGTPATIDSTAFYGCNNLTTINVPWSEGAVAGAPWGATNATINYNHVG